MYGSWKEAKDLGILTDMSPDSQDKYAVWKIKQRGALDYVLAGDLDHAIPKLRNEWTSLPGAKQSHMKMTEAKAKFDQYVAEFSKP